MDLLDRVKLLRPAGGFAAGTVGTIADVWCHGRCLVEVEGASGPAYVEVDEGALRHLSEPQPAQRSEPPHSAA